MDTEVVSIESLRVLVVEDDPALRLMLVRELARTYTVYEAEDGAQALEVVDEIPTPDLVVSDVDMPRMTGIELVSRIKADQRLRSLPVIIVSYKDREEDRLKGLDAGADHYMTKNSFQDDTFISTVLDLIGPAA